MRRWLLKTEPGDYRWEQFVQDRRTAWTGVRNHQAANNLKAMQTGDLAFFYRSVKDPAIVGTMRVAAEAYPDSTADEPRWVCVDVVPVAAADPVPLKAIRAVAELADMALLRQSRLSVMPVADDHWRLLCEMAGLDPRTGAKGEAEQDADPA